jgi:hypothetical protein
MAEVFGTPAARRTGIDLRSYFKRENAPASYTALHPEASLGAQDKKAVCFWAAMEIEGEK